MASPLFVEESGRLLRLDAKFDLSDFTELSIIFCKPDNTSVTKTTADGVALGTVAVTDADLGELAADEYIEYSIEVGLITANDAGEWSAQLRYTKDTSSPIDDFYGEIAYFSVAERCDT